MTTFPSIRIEGGLLGPDVLEELLVGNLPGQRATDFGLDAKRNLTDEIAAAFADARALWGGVSIAWTDFPPATWQPPSHATPG